MCIVTRVLEAKLRHLLARLHCFQVLYQLACEDFGNFRQSYKGIPLYMAFRAFARTQVIPFADRFGTFASRQFKQPLWCSILGHQKWLQHTIHFLPSVAVTICKCPQWVSGECGTWNSDLSSCIFGLF